MPGTVKSGLLADTVRLCKCDSQEIDCWTLILTLDRGHFITDLLVHLVLVNRASDFLVHFNKRYKTRGLSPGFSFQINEIWSQSSSLSFNNTVFSVKQLMLFRSYAESMVEFFTA